MEKAVYTILDLAERWSCSKDIVYDLIRRGEIKPFRLGREYRVRAEEVARFETQ